MSSRGGASRIKTNLPPSLHETQRPFEKAGLSVISASARLIVFCYSDPLFLAFEDMFYSYSPIVRSLHSFNVFPMYWIWFRRPSLRPKSTIIGCPPGKSGAGLGQQLIRVPDENIVRSHESRKITCVTGCPVFFTKARALKACYCGLAVCGSFYNIQSP
jgi:hypothetical protein